MTPAEIDNLHRRLAYELWRREGSRPDTAAIYWEAVRPKVIDIVFWRGITVRRIKEQEHASSGD
jgi:hypothetical protein